MTNSTTPEDAGGGVVGGGASPTRLTNDLLRQHRQRRHGGDQEGVAMVWRARPWRRTGSTSRMPRPLATPPLAYRMSAMASASTLALTSATMRRLDQRQAARDDQQHRRGEVGDAGGHGTARVAAATSAHAGTGEGHCMVSSTGGTQQPVEVQRARSRARQDRSGLRTRYAGLAGMADKRGAGNR